MAHENATQSLLQRREAVDRQPHKGPIGVGGAKFGRTLLDLETTHAFHSAGEFREAPINSINAIHSDGYLGL